MRILCLTLLSALILQVDMFAQLDNPLEPAKPPKSQELGIITGIGMNNLNGDLYVDCETCLFQDAASFGWLAGLNYQYEFSDPFNIGIIGGYNSLSFESSYRETIIETIEGASYNIPYSQTANVQIDAIFFFPYLQIDLFDVLFLRSGVNLSFVFNKNKDHVMTLKENSIITNDGRVIDLTLQGTENNSITFEDNEFADFNDLQYFIPVNLGADIPLGLTSTLSPSFLFNIPLNKASNFNQGYNVSNWRFLVEFSYYLKNND